MSYKPASRSVTAVNNRSNELAQGLQSMQGEVAKSLPKSLNLNAERLLRIILTEVRKTPDLANCDRASFYGAVMQCAQLGLEPGAGLGHVYLLPFRNKGRQEVQFIIGYQGMIELAERSGKVTVDAQVVYEKDEFKYTLGLHPWIDHTPYIGDEDPGQVVASYAVARYDDGRSKFRVVSRRELEATRQASRGGKSQYSPWNTHFAEMARKTAVRRIFKMLPKTTEMARAQELEDSVEVEESQDLAELLAPETLENEPTELTEVKEATDEKVSQDPVDVQKT